MISPSNTYKGLTVGGAGTERGEPDKYYPTGTRSYFRLLPNDAVQAAALTTAMRDRGCTRIGLLNDGETYGRGLAADIRASAKRLGLKIVVNRRSGRAAPKSLRKANCMAFAGITANHGVSIFKTAPKKLKLFGADGVAESDFAAHLPRSVARRTLVTVATLSNEAYNQPSILKPTDDSYKLLGYEAMKLILDGVAAGATSKAALTTYLQNVRNRASVLGTYSFDANGDTTLRSYGLYALSGHGFRYAGTITAA